MRLGRPPGGLGDMRKLRSYGSWSQMIQRCQNPNNPRYKDYGGRGIAVCERWQKFPNFLADMGERPLGLQIERKDNDGHYEKCNCIWADRKTQMNNRRNARTAPRNRMTRQEAAVLATKAAAAKKRADTLKKIEVARPLWRSTAPDRLTTEAVAEAAELSIKTIYNELGRRPRTKRKGQTNAE